MKIKKRLVTMASVFVGLALVVGIWAVAATNFGSQTDPLITLSYINDVLKGQITTEVNAKIDSKVSALEAELEARIAQLEGSGGGSGSGSKYSVVSLDQGKVLTGEVGTEIMLRVGTATCHASASPGLIDMTTGGVLENSGGLSKNHMYVITISGRGITAGNYVMVLVRGQYTIS